MTGVLVFCFHLSYVNGSTILEWAQGKCAFTFALGLLLTSKFSLVVSPQWFPSIDDHSRLADGSTEFEERGDIIGAGFWSANASDTKKEAVVTPRHTENTSNDSTRLNHPEAVRASMPQGLQTPMERHQYSHPRSPQQFGSDSHHPNKSLL
jgi:hypothetical protein